MKSSLLILLWLGFLKSAHSFQPPFSPRVRIHRRAANQFSLPPRRSPLMRPSRSNVLNGASSVSSSINIAAKSGLVALATQFVLSKFVFSNKKSPKVLQDTAEYTAHSVVALALMVLLSGLGIRGWWWDPSPISGASRILDISSSGRWMAAVVMGCFALWDIPISVKVKALRKPDVIAHHCVMTLVAAVGVFLLPMEYVIYYFGIVELSSIPLIFYDQTAHWVDTIKTNEASSTPTKLEKLQGNLGIVAGIAFTLVRVVSFTKVTLRNFLPDCTKALEATAAGPQKVAIRALMVACGGFTFLQWYWFSNMIKAFKEGDV